MKFFCMIELNNLEPSTEPATEPATEPPSSTTVLPSVRPQPFRPRFFNKTKRVVIPLRDRPPFNPANLSKRQIKKRAVPSNF